MSTPSSTIYLLTRGNQLSPDQHHTFMFANASAQQAWFFESGSYIEINPTQYIRVSTNEVKIPRAKEEIDGHYSYMCIKTTQSLPNSQTHSRYWYAFIVDTEYVSDSCTKITYEIDVLQTFLFDGSVNFKTAHVERCHWNTDVVGDNRVAEPLSTPSYVYNEKEIIEIKTGVIVEIIRDQTIGGRATTPSEIFFSIGSATSYYAFDMSSVNERASLRALLNEPALYNDGVLISIYTCPADSFLKSGQRDAATFRLNDGEFPRIIPIAKNGSIIGGYDMNIEATGIGTTKTIDGYAPKNNKLFTYPFNVMQVTNTSGDEAMFKFEEWNTTPVFDLETTWIDPVATLIPSSYEKSNCSVGQNIQNFRYGLSMKDYPICGFASDAYQTWLAQRSQSQYMSLIAKGVSDYVGLSVLGIGASLGEVAPYRALTGVSITAASFGSSVANVIENVIEAKNKPDKIVSNMGGSTLKIANHHFGFEFARLSVNDYYAKIVDNFFTQFGYAQDALMDIDSWLFPSGGAKIRPHFKYIKTTDIHVNGACNAKYKDLIETIFNRGVTFWETDTAIGDYSVDNRPATHTP